MKGTKTTERKKQDRQKHKTQHSMSLTIDQDQVFMFSTSKISNHDKTRSGLLHIIYTVKISVRSLHFCPFSRQMH